MEELQTIIEKLLKDSVNPVDVLVRGLDLLDKETPQYMFRTKDPYKIIIRNKSGSDIIGGLSVNYLFFFKVPGLLNAMTYGGLTIYDRGSIFQGFIPGDNGGFIPIGRRSQHDVPLEDIYYGFDILGQNHVIHPYRNKEEHDLFFRIIYSFKKFGEFTLNVKKKSRFVKPMYDIARGVRRITNNNSSEVKLLAENNASLDQRV